MYSPKYGDVSFRRLAQVGTALSLRASKELNAADDGNNPTGAAQDAASLLPGGAQIGLERINTTILQAQDVLQTLTQEGIPDGTITQSGGEDAGKLSWGALNNVDDPWSGLDAVGMVATATALTAAMFVLFESISIILSLAKAGGGVAKNPSGRYVLGKYSVVKQNNPNSLIPALPPDISSMLGIRSTVYPLGNALNAGFGVFFGIDTSSALGALTSGLSSAGRSPGFNTIIARSIIRSSLTIADKFRKAFQSSSVVAGIKNILDIVEVIRASKLIAAVNVFAALGDQALTIPDDTYAATDGIPEEPLKQSKIDAIDDDAYGSAVQKNRLKNKLKLAWSSGRSPALYLLPESVLTMNVIDNDLNSFMGPAQLAVDSDNKTQVQIKSTFDGSVNARISLDDVKDFEDELDAEYMPFYFHDLRTNEIISFHAFLSNLTDNYTSNWEQTDGYGRVDPVRVYKNTNRKIELGFSIVATSERDFDDMWVRINKLTTLVYPQYTKGRMMNDGGGTAFVQPFSQLIGASPLIRLRFGDLLRSNYSKFALARLFGAADGTMQLNDTPIDFNWFELTGHQSSLDFSQIPLSKDPSYKFTMDVAHGWPAHISTGFGISVPLIGSTGPKFAPIFNVDGADLQWFEFTVSDVTDEGVSIVSPKLKDASDMPIDVKYALSSKYENGPILQRVLGSGAKYEVPHQLLTPTVETIQKFIFNKLKPKASNTKAIDELSNFLSENGNALAKSFKETGGKGLAGTIDSMNFNWLEKSTWDDRTGSCAPKMCQVSISFTPIHDISPGIDHLGYNRSPIYPVGRAMKNGKK